MIMIGNISFDVSVIVKAISESKENPGVRVLGYWCRSDENKWPLDRSNLASKA